MSKLFMAKKEHINKNCSDGPLFVDESCIDCGSCYHLSPKNFKADSRSKSFIVKQPTDFFEWEKVKLALVSCPTNSIGVDGASSTFKNAPLNLPLHIADEVYYLGFTSEASFGASSYLIVHPSGNILIDSPRFNSFLVKKIEELGGIKFMFLSHRDDVADHRLFANHFKCTRIIHKYEVNEGTDDCEMIISEQNDVSLGSDVKIIFTPGHTEGHLVLLYKNKFLFTGDHLFYDHENDKIYASKTFNWHSWKKQVESLHKLCQYQFEWIMPGHGGWTRKHPDQIQEVLKTFC